MQVTVPQQMNHFGSHPFTLRGAQTVHAEARENLVQKHCPEKQQASSVVLLKRLVAYYPPHLGLV